MWFECVQILFNVKREEGTHQNNIYKYQMPQQYRNLQTSQITTSLSDRQHIVNSLYC